MAEGPPAGEAGSGPAVPGDTGPVRDGPHFRALILILKRVNAIERDGDTRAIDADMAGLAARIEASPELLADAKLRDFARLVSTVTEGSGGRPEQAWQALHDLRSDLFKLAVAPLERSRLEALDAAYAQLQDGSLDHQTIDRLPGIDASARAELHRANAQIVPLVARTRPAAGTIAGQPGPEAAANREAWELRALRGALSSDEAARLASHDPLADDRAREQHKRSLAAGGEKALAAVWIMLQLRKAAIDLELRLAPTDDRIRRAAQTEAAIDNVEEAMKVGGWDTPEMPEKGPDAGADLKAGPPTPAAPTRRRQDSSYDR